MTLPLLLTTPTTGRCSSSCVLFFLNWRLPLGRYQQDGHRSAILGHAQYFFSNCLKFKKLFNTPSSAGAADDGHIWVFCYRFIFNDCLLLLCSHPGTMDYATSTACKVKNPKQERFLKASLPTLTGIALLATSCTVLNAFMPIKKWGQINYLKVTLRRFPKGKPIGWYHF
jgi:hypothetical protein